MADIPVEVAVAIACFSAVAGVGGVVIGGLVARNNDRRKQRIEFAKQQLSELLPDPEPKNTHPVAQHAPR